MWEKHGTVGQATDDNIIRLMLIACWIPKATNTHSEYVIRIAFPTAIVVARTRPHVRLFVHCLSCVVLCICVFLLRHHVNEHVVN